MKAKIDGMFVEITWQEGSDKKVLLITPQDIVKNYRRRPTQRVGSTLY